MITEEYTGKSRVKYIFEYTDCNSFDHLEKDLIKQTYAVCFLENTDKIMIVHNGKKDTWGLIGGSVEEGESLEQTLRRELQEEGNLKLISCKALGYQKVIDTRDNSFIYQVRYFAVATPYGDFVSDPDGTIDKVVVIDPLEYKKYFDWKKIGDEIFKKALKIKNNLN